MEYSFDVEVAKKYGVDEAIFIKNLQFWIMKNRMEGTNQFDGRTWTYNSNIAFTAFFPFWTEKQIRRILSSLEEKKVIRTGCYNKIGFDRTLWYAFEDEAEFIDNPLHLPKRAIQSCPNGQFRFAQTGGPIPDDKPDSKPDRKPGEPSPEQPGEPARKAEKVPPPEAVRLARVLLEERRRIEPGFMANEAKAASAVLRWARDLDLLQRIDGRAPGDVEAVIRWACRDSFWRVNILSGAAVRKHFDRLFLKARGGSSGRAPAASAEVFNAWKIPG